MRLPFFFKYAIIIFLLLLMAQQVTATASIIVNTIDLDGSGTSSLTQWTTTGLNVGDSATNLKSKAYIRFNYTGNISQINSVKSNITSSNVCFYLYSKTNNPMNGIDVQSNYSTNDSWVASSTLSQLDGSNNLTDYTIKKSFINNNNYYCFDVTSEMKNDTGTNLSIVLEPVSISANSVADLFTFNSSRASSNKPYLIINYDNNTYQDGITITHPYNMNQLDCQYNNTDAFNWFALILKTNQSEFIVSQDTPSTDGWTRTGIINSSALVNGIDYTISSFDYVSRRVDQLGAVNCNNNTYSSSNFLTSSAGGNTLSYNLQRSSHKYYLNTSNKTISFFGDVISPWVGYQNGSILDLGAGRSMENLREDFSENNNTYFKYNNTIYNITNVYTDFERGFTNNANTARQREIWIPWNDNNSYGIILFFQNNDTISTSGSMVVKSTGDFISFDGQDAADIFTNYNKTGLPDRLVRLNTTTYVNSTKGYLILNRTVLGLFESVHGVATMNGTFFYNTGSVVDIDTVVYTEDILLRKWDIVDNVTNGYLTRDVLDDVWSVSGIHNFSVRGNNNNNISVIIYNNTKIYNSSAIRVVNNISSSYNNLSINGNKTYNIKALNVSLNSSALINVTVNQYNSMLFNFTATNSTTGQTMNMTVDNDIFPISNGGYHITFNNSSYFTTALGSSISFYNIPVNNFAYVISRDPSSSLNPIVAVGVAAMGAAITIAVYNMYRRRGRPPMVFIPGLI